MKKFFTLTLALMASFSLWAETVLLINQSTGAVNGTDFRCTSTSSSKSYTVEGDSFSKYIALGGAHTTPVGAYQNNKFIQYDAKTNEVEVTVWAYNKASSDYKFYISMIEEGTTVPTIHEYTATKSTGTKKVVTFTPSRNATIYIHVGNNSNVFICQAQINENGTDLLKGGEVGYSVRLDSCRVGREKTLFTLDGIEYNATSNNVKVWTSGNPIKLKATTEYIKFTISQKETVSIKAAGTYSVTRGDYNADSTFTNNADVPLASGTWYIRPNGSNVIFASLAFASYEVSTDATLATINVGANALDLSKFVDNEGVLEYDYELSMGTTDVPAVTYTTTDANANVEKVDAADVDGTTTLTVTAEDGTTTKVYKINFSVKSALGTDATLSDIKVGGVSIEGFDPETPSYNYNIGVYAPIPEVTYTLNDPNASALYKEHNETMVDTIDVTAEDGETTKRYLVSFVRATATELAEISASTTWDWSKAGSATAEQKATTMPTNAEEFNFADVLISPDDEFNAAALNGIAQFANRSDHYFQGNQIKFNTTKPGKVVVTYSNTGGSRPYRHVEVNGTLSEEGSANQDMKDTEEFAVTAGDVIIKFYIPDATNPQERSGDNVGYSMGRISKIVFTKDPETSLDNTEDEVNAVKYFKDGQLFIEKNGHVYNVFGACVK